MFQKIFDKPLFFITFQVALYGIVGYGIRTLRVCFGPEPFYLCTFRSFFGSLCNMFGTINILMVTITRFLFVCVWKSMRQMDDDLIARFALILSGVLSSFLCLAHFLQTSGQYRVSNKYQLTFLVYSLKMLPSTHDFFLPFRIALVKLKNLRNGKEFCWPQAF